MAPAHVNGSSDGHYSNGDSNVDSNGSYSTTEQPFDLASRLTIQLSSKAFSSFAVSLITLPAGSVFAPITGITSATKAYSSVQTGPDSHIELNSDLVFCNHSCAPTLEFDMSRMEVRVAADRDLKVGDMLTFWYPSSEWEMAQPFECSCGSERCKGWISGAGQMSEKVVREYWLNPHIVKMLDEKNAKNDAA